MADKLKVTREDIRQAFFDIAAEMERECGDWKSLSETDADRVLKKRIVAMIKEKYPEDYLYPLELFGEENEEVDSLNITYSEYVSKHLANKD